MPWLCLRLAGVNGAVNGGVVSSSSTPSKGSGGSTAASATAHGPLEQARAPGSKPRGPKSSPATAEPLDKSGAHKPKEKVSRRSQRAFSAAEVSCEDSCNLNYFYSQTHRIAVVKLENNQSDVGESSGIIYI